MTQDSNAGQPTTPAKRLKQFQEETVNHVLGKVQEFNQTGELNLPEKYSPGNALKSAWLTLLETKDAQKKPVLETCTKESIVNALLDMAVQGLSPMKKQCAFIAYGNKLIMQREYHGNIALAKRYGGVKDVRANVVYEGDNFAFSIDAESGLKKVVKHEQTLKNIDTNKIIGAYATVLRSDGTTDVEIMTIQQIRTAWEMGGSGTSKAHKQFTDQMAKKTVINRACKLYISSSDDGGLVEGKETRTVDPDREDKKQTVKENANKEPLDVEEAELVNENQEQEQGQSEEDHHPQDPRAEYQDPPEDPQPKGQPQQTSAPF